MGLFKHNQVSETVLVEGMKCEHCAKKVVDALKAVKVKAVVVLEKKSVEVTYDSDKTNLEEIKKVINGLGYSCL